MKIVTSLDHGAHHSLEFALVIPEFDLVDIRREHELELHRGKESRND